MYIDWKPRCAGYWSKGELNILAELPRIPSPCQRHVQLPWEDFQSLLPTDTPRHSVANPASPAASTSQRMSKADEAKYQQAEAYLDKRQRRRHKRHYEKDTGDVSPSRYPSTP